MTAVAAAPAPVTPKIGSPGSPDNPKAGALDGDRFARTLARRQAADVEDSAPRPDATPKRTARADLDDEAVASDDDVLAQTTLTSTATPPPAPWPPPGLAALIGMPMAADPAGAALDAETGDTPDLLATPATAPTPAAPLALPLQPSAASGALPPQGAVAALPADGDAAVPMPLELATAADSIEPAATADAPEPQPVAFALPASTPPAVRASAPLLDAPLPTPDMHGEDFEARFGAQLEWMAGQKIGHARIRISPPEMGPVEVRLQLDGDRIAADFISGNSETRQALEHGLPRLRDLLGEHGFQLAHAGVGNGETGQRDGNPPSGPMTDTRGDDDASSPRAQATPLSRRAGLLDAYA